MAVGEVGLGLEKGLVMVVDMELAAVVGLVEAEVVVGVVVVPVVVMVMAKEWDSEQGLGLAEEVAVEEVAAVVEVAIPFGQGRRMDMEVGLVEVEVWVAGELEEEVAAVVVAEEEEVQMEEMAMVVVLEVA